MVALKEKKDKKKDGKKCVLVELFWFFLWLNPFLKFKGYCETDSAGLQNLFLPVHM